MSDAKIRQAIDAITDKNWTVDGEVVSLADIGYASVGIDEGWEGCGMGITVKGRKTQHYANGTPAINAKFPDMAGLVAYGHSKQLRMGWYLNGCACGEHVELHQNYAGDVSHWASAAPLPCVPPRISDAACYRSSCCTTSVSMV